MIRDGHVRLLPTQVANKIAAGEVVERPASVVKELVENSIDAGATRIDIAITAGGRNLVQVRDDGCGMERNDALLSLERQATSKIRDVDDIEHITTLGFRGEAIPSIASVSRFTMTTRPANADSGTAIQINAGMIAEVRDAGCPPGTTIEVRDLFCNVPARRKFLRSYQTEENHIKNIFMIHALAHPDRGFSLTIDGREIYRFPPGASLEERIQELFGNDTAAEMAPVFSDEGNVHIHGYIEKPNHSNPNLRRDQFIFINGRPATAPVITYALKEAYPRQQGDARPAAIIFIEMDAAGIDVNVHPTKREVRFRRPQDIKAALISAIGAAIGTVRQPPPQEVKPVVGTEPVKPFQPAAAPIAPHPQEQTPIAPALPFVVPFTSARTSADQELPLPVAPIPADETDNPAHIKHSSSLAASQGPWRWFKYLASTESGYLLLETDAGLVTVNTQAAQERVFYEHLIATGSAISQPLLMPRTVKMNPIDFARIKTFKSAIENAGFVLEEFGTDTWKIDAEPQIASDIDADALITSIAGDISEGGVKRGGEKWREELIAKSIAKNCANTARHLTPETATKLMEQLASCNMPYICPRGKPVMIFTSNRELNRKFGK